MRTGRVAALTVVFVLLATWAYADDCGGGWRYADNLDGTITDCRTGLIWLKNANCLDTSNGIERQPYGYLDWYDAVKWVKGLHNGLCSLSDGSFDGDWRLPTRTEWMAMIAGAKSKGFYWPMLTGWVGNEQWTNGNPFFNVEVTSAYWSSTTHPLNADLAWFIWIGTGSLDAADKSYKPYVWPVRGGSAASFDSLTIE